MGKVIKFGRREFLVLSGGLTAIAAGTSNAAEPTTQADAVSAEFGGIPENGAMERFTLDMGFRAPRGGPVTALGDGTLLWVTTDPEAPYLAKSMYSISRLAMRRSTDGGRSWSKRQVLQKGSETYSVMSFVIRALKSGNVIHIFTRSSGYDYETGLPEKSLRETYFEHSADNGKTWSAPQKMPTGERYQGDILSMEQLRDGRLVYPFCFLTNVSSQFAVSVMYSDDDGKTWQRSSSVLRTGGGGFESGASEPTLVELPDGKLWMLIRAQTGFLWESFSDDRGKTWSAATESKFPSSNAPASMLRLKSGEIAVAWNPHVDSNYARQSLVIALTSDGKTLKGMREFDFTDFTDDPKASIPHVTYPFLTEAKDGTIAISYNKGNWSRHNRPTLARINRSWILEKTDVVNFHDGRTGWHTIDPGPNRAAAIEKYLLENDKLWLEITQNPNNKNNDATGIVRSIPLVQQGEITFTVNSTKADGYLILGDSLLSPRNLDEGCLRIRISDGKIHLAAGKEERLQNDRRTTKYNYLLHRIKEETEYPKAFGSGEELNISVRYNSAAQKAQISVNGGPSVELKTAKVLGLAYVSLLASNGGNIRLNSINTNLK
ncbi:MAG: sialidase family protein [Pyrinomonadaceae bacterium]